mmetsp:Transcript_12637/g.29984  ORF Transcript_12637/g.29984 Transcript_12637/m.29984 type:complete len:570 (+) Transcript_12637:90-1799(+)
MSRTTRSATAEARRASAGAAAEDTAQGSCEDQCENPSLKVPNSKLPKDKWSCTRIVFWIYKGGAAKTTSLLHVAASLAALGYKVLVMDADGQANSSQHLSPEESTMKYDTLESLPAWKNGRHGVEEGVDCFPDCDPQDPRLILHTNPDFVTLSQLLMDCHSNYDKFKDTLKNREVALSVNNDRNLGQNLYLLHGHADIINFEAKLNQVGYSIDESSIRTQTAIGQVMGALEEKFGFDFIFSDAAPSSGSLNSHVTFECDYIQPTIFHDSYSLQAVDRALKKVLPEWREKHKRFSNSIPEALEDGIKKYPGIKWRSNFPTVLPLLISNYISTPRRKDGLYEMCYNDACLVSTMRLTMSHMMALRYAYFKAKDKSREEREQDKTWQNACRLHMKQPYDESSPLSISEDEKDELWREAKRLASIPWYSDEVFHDGKKPRPEDMIILGCRKFTSALLAVAHELGRTIPELEEQPSSRQANGNGHKGDFAVFMEAAIKHKEEQVKKQKSKTLKRKRGRDGFLADFAHACEIEGELKEEEDGVRKSRDEYLAELGYAKKEYEKFAMFLLRLAAQK